MRWTAAKIGALVVIVLIVVLLFAFLNPWSGFLKGRLSKSEAKGETTADAFQGQVEQSVGQSDVEGRATEVRIIVHQAEESAHAVEIEARAAPGADEPLDAGAADRLHSADRELCRIRETVCRDR